MKRFEMRYGEMVEDHHGEWVKLGDVQELVCVKNHITVWRPYDGK